MSKIIQRQLIKNLSQDALLRLDPVKTIVKSASLGNSYDFSYAKFYLNQRIFSCFTVENYLEKYCDLLEKPIDQGNFIENSTIFDKSSLIFSAHDLSISIKNNQILQLMYHCNLNNSLMIKNWDEKLKTTELFGFYTAVPGPEGLQDLKTKLPLFMQFCLEFKERARPLIISGELSTEKLHSLGTIANAGKSEQDFQKINTDVAAFNPSINKYYLGAPFANHHLTQKEFECLKLFFLGRTAKQIAKDLGGISHRTVEKHLLSIKSKAECADISELRAILLNNVFFLQALNPPPILL